MSAAPYQADGADARAHGYGLDRNPYTWNHEDRGDEPARNASKREAWAEGWAMATPVGARGIYRDAVGLPLMVTTLAKPERFAGRSATDATPWVGVSVAFEGVAGKGFIPALAVVWDAPMTGQQAYEADCVSRPAYHDGAPRKAWADLCPAFRDNWNRHAGAGA